MQTASRELWWGVFTVAFVTTALLETFLPFRSLPSSTPRRWATNSVLLAVSNIALVCVYQFTGIALALDMQARSHGLLNSFGSSYWLRFTIGLFALDSTAYFSHRLFHAVSLLWRVHQVHHSETDLDLATGLRFHPLEALIVQGLLLLAIAGLGLPPAAVAASGLVVLVADFFTHANFRIPERADRMLRFLIITPGMHRVHHHAEIPLQNANFGTIFSFWDRLFGTYRAGTAAEPRYGLAEIAGGSNLGSVALLLLPFRHGPALRPEQGPQPAPLLSLLASGIAALAIFRKARKSPN